MILGTVTVCEDDENNILEIQCPIHRVILIYNIAFGRSSTDVCPVENISETDSDNNCYSDQSWSVGLEKCMGKQSCSLEASSQEFGDPCPETKKYLSISYTCRTSKNNTIFLYEK